MAHPHINTPAAMMRGGEFARHLRRNLLIQGGNQGGDAVYTNSPTLPRDLPISDAKVGHGASRGNWNTDGVRTNG